MDSPLEKSEGEDTAAHSVSEASLDRTAERKVLAKLDVYVVGLVTLLYLLNLLDRSNIGNARIAGLQADLGLSDYQYQLAITFTYLPYLLAELPVTLLLKTLGPRIVLPTLVTLWGVVTMCQGFVRTLGGLITCRVFLGLFEGGLVPCIMLYIAGFYKRTDLQWRTGMIFSAASLAGAFSGLAAAGIENLNGHRNIPGWGWIFIIEGSVTAVIGLLSALIMPSSLATAYFLTPSERTALVARLRDDKLEERVTEETGFQFVQVKRAFLSPMIWLLGWACFANGITGLGLSYFLPSITQGFGYPTIKTQLLTVAPYSVSFTVTMIMCHVSDRYKLRGAVIVFMSGVQATGFALFLANVNQQVSYLGLFFAVSGSYCIAPTIFAWIINNTAPHYKRSSMLAMSSILMNFGGIASTWIFPTSAAPEYKGGTITNLVWSLISVLSAAVTMLWIRLATNRKVRNREEILAPFSEDEKTAWNELGDRHPDFSYIS